MKAYCPYCKKEVEYEIENRYVKRYKGIEIDVEENVAVCIECKNDLYINNLEENNNKRIYDAYREKTDIIAPKDIIDLREKYDISQRELTAILGLGKMTINRYERGGIPTKSQSDYIKLLKENDNEFIKKVKESYQNGSINDKTYKKIVSPNTLTDLNREDIKKLSKKYINSVLYRKPDIFNGYKSFDLELVENILSYIASKVRNLTITSMNKYLWYIDMLSFKERGVGITGLTYQRQQFGPTIANFKYDDISKLDDKYKIKYAEDENGSLKTNIESNKNFDLSNISENELEIINKTIKMLKNKKVSEISEMSHKEDGWIKTKMLKDISFEHAMKLNI